MRLLLVSRLIAVVVLLLAAGGCGGSGSEFARESPSAILDAAWSASKTLTSMRTVTEFEAGPESNFRLDLRVDRRGDCVGSNVGTEFGPTLTMDFIQVAGRSFLKASAQFWQGHYGAAAANLLAGRWATGKKVAASVPMAVCKGAITTLRNPAAPFSGGTPTGPVSTSTFDGVHALGVKVNGSVQGDAGSFPYSDTFYVSENAPHYLLGFSDSKGTGTTTYTDLNKPFSVAAPARAIDADAVLP